MVEEHFSFRQEGEKDDMRGYPDRKDENERNIAHRPPPSEPFHVKNSEVEFFEIQRNKKKKPGRRERKVQYKPSERGKLKNEGHKTFSQRCRRRILQRWR